MFLLAILTFSSPCLLFDESQKGGDICKLFLFACLFALLVALLAGDLHLFLDAL